MALKPATFFESFSLCFVSLLSTDFFNCKKEDRILIDFLFSFYAKASFETLKVLLFIETRVKPKYKSQRIAVE